MVRAAPRRAASAALAVTFLFCLQQAVVDELWEQWDMPSFTARHSVALQPEPVQQEQQHVERVTPQLPAEAGSNRAAAAAGDGGGGGDSAATAVVLAPDVSFRGAYVSALLLPLLPLLVVLTIASLACRTPAAPPSATASPSPAAAGGGCRLRGRRDLVAAAVCAAAAFAAIGSILLLDSWSLLCNYSPAELRATCGWSVELLRTIDREIAPHKVWLVNGTLLAAVRSQRSTNFLIRNDHDIDVCFDSAIYAALVALLRRHGYLFQPRLAVGAGGEGNMVRKLYVYPGFIRPFTGHSGPLSLDMEECGTPAPPLRQLQGCNGATFSAPADAEEELARTFGANWRTPRAENHWGLCMLFGWL